MPFDWQGLNSLFQEQASSLREQQGPESAGLSGLLADAQRAFLEGAGGYTGYGHGSGPMGGPAGMGGQQFAPRPHPEMPGGFPSPNNNQFIDPHEAAFGQGRPDQTTGRQQLGYWDNGLNSRLSRQLLGLTGMNPYGLVSKSMNYLTGRHNSKQDRELFESLHDAGKTGSDTDFADALGNMYGAAQNQADWANMLNNNMFWGTKEGGARLRNSVGLNEDGNVVLQGDPSGIFGYGSAKGDLLGGLGPPGNFFQSGMGLHSGPGGMTAGSLLRAVNEGRWGGGGVQDFFLDDQVYDGRRI